MAIKKYKTKKGMRYGYEIQINGKRYSKSGFQIKRDAQQAEIEEEKRLRNSSKNLDFRLLIVERMNYLKENATLDYFNENKRTFEKFIIAFSEKIFVTEISRDEVVNYLERHHPKKHGYNYALKKINALFQHGVEKEWTDYNPCKGIKRLSTDRRIKYVPPKEDMDKVINITKTFEEMAFLIVLKNTLARVSEIYNLTWQNVDLENRQIILWTRKKKGGVHTPRPLTINEHLHYTLSLIDREHEYVFWNSDTGKKYEDRKKLMIGLCADAKVKPFMFHSFRHFGASQLAMKGVSLPEIQMILGHDNVITTSKYIQSLGINKTEAINLIE